MYSIYAGDVCIFDDSVENIRVKLIEPTLTMEDSAAGSLEFTLPIQNEGYGNDRYGNPVIELMRTTIKVYRRLEINGTYVTEEIWEGRPITEEHDFYNNRKIYCEGELAYLNDTTQPQAQYFGNAGAILDVSGFLRTIIENHNKKVDASKQFTVGAVTVHNEAIGQYRYTDYGTTLEAINKLVEDIGGHLRVRKQNGVRYLDWYAEFGQTSTANQVIEFGRNLLDVSKTLDMTTLCTVLLPLGKKTSNGGAITVGDEIPVYWRGDGSVITSNGEVYNPDPEYPDRYGHMCSDGIEVQPGHTYFVTCRNSSTQSESLALYMITEAEHKGEVGRVLSIKTASGTTVTDAIEEKVEIPEAPEGSNFQYYLWLCSLTSTGLKAHVYDSKEVPENLDEYVTVESVNNGSLYVSNKELISKYGWIERQHVWDDVESPSILLKRAESYLATGQFEEVVLEVSALDLLALGEENVRGLNVLDIIHVKSEPHGIDKYLPITKLEIPLNDPANMQFTIGIDETKNLTSANAEMNESLLAKIGAMPSSSTLLQNAYEDAANLINAATGGYITIVQNEDGTETAEFVVSDVPFDDIEHATNLWVWNVNGLCHSDSYPISGESLNVAITMDGQIVADRMTTGTLRAIQIVGCDVTVFDDDAFGTGWIRLNQGKLLGGYGATVDAQGKTVFTNTYAWMDAHTDIYDIPTQQQLRGFQVFSPGYQIWTDSLATRKTGDYGQIDPATGEPYPCWKGAPEQRIIAVTGMNQDGTVASWAEITFINGIMTTVIS